MGIMGGGVLCQAVKRQGCSWMVVEWLDRSKKWVVMEQTVSAPSKVTC